jgi:hypothetical protein
MLKSSSPVTRNLIKATHAYIGIRIADGSCRAICCDDPGYEDQTAEIIAEWESMGRRIERLPIAEAKSRMFDRAIELSMEGE